MCEERFRGIGEFQTKGKYEEMMGNCGLGVEVRGKGRRGKKWGQ